MLNKKGRHSSIAEVDARKLSVDDLRLLARWSGSERETYWNDLDAQGILNAYHAASEWTGLDAWLSEENEQREAALTVWGSIRAGARARAQGREMREVYEWRTDAATPYVVALIGGAR